MGAALGPQVSAELGALSVPFLQIDGQRWCHAWWSSTRAAQRRMWLCHWGPWARQRRGSDGTGRPPAPHSSMDSAWPHSTSVCLFLRDLCSQRPCSAHPIGVPVLAMLGVSGATALLSCTIGCIAPAAGCWELPCHQPPQPMAFAPRLGLFLFFGGGKDLYDYLFHNKEQPPRPRVTQWGQMGECRCGMEGRVSCAVRAVPRCSVLAPRAHPSCARLARPLSQSTPLPPEGSTLRAMPLPVSGERTAQEQRFGGRCWLVAGRHSSASR